MDALHPGTVPLGKVNFNAKYEYEYAKNLKLLQAVFVKVGIEKVVDIDKLTKGKYQDNLEFIQWLKQYFDHNWKEGQAYDAVGRRQNQQCFVAPKTERPRLHDVSNSMVNENTAPIPQRTPQKTTPVSRSQSVCHTPGQTNKLQARLDAMMKEMEQEKEARTAIEKQRDFYYGKLRNIEILLEDDAVLKVDIGVLRSTIQTILFNPAGDFISMEDPAMDVEQ